MYGYPIDLAASVALGAASAYAREHPHFREIRFILFSDHDFQVYQRELASKG